MSRIRVRFAAPGPAGSAVVVTIAYRGSPHTMPGPDGPAGWEELTDGVLVAAQPHGAPTWFPCNDRMADKATYRVSVTTDAAYRVVSNGTLVARRTVGRRVEWVHEQRQPMAPYLATLQIGRYAAEHVPAETSCWLVAPPTRMPAVRAAFADQPRMLAVFSGLYGPYPFDQYTVAMANNTIGNGSQFFITLADLDQALRSVGTYSILGRVVSGLDVVDEIAAVPVNDPRMGVPLSQVTIETIEISSGSAPQASGESDG